MAGGPAFFAPPCTCDVMMVSFVVSIRCQRETFTCAQGDADCLYAPLSYSVNFIAVPLAAVRVPTDLFTMRGPVTSRRRLQFELKLLNAYDPTTANPTSRINEAFFSVDQVQSCFIS